MVHLSSVLVCLLQAEEHEDVGSLPPSAVGASGPTLSLGRRRVGGRHSPPPAPEGASSRPPLGIDRGGLGPAVSCRQGRRGQSRLRRVRRSSTVFCSLL